MDGCEYFDLDSNLPLLIQRESDASDYKAEYSLKYDSWTIRLRDTHSKLHNPLYEIKISPPAQSRATHNGTPALTTLVSESSEPKALLAMWKVYERLVQRHLLKDDLVQLFGYYQYKLKYSIHMTFHDQSLLAAPFWRTVKLVTTGCGIGLIISTTELGSLYELPTEDIELVLKQMKSIGYEIRNHRTNRQIPAGMTLIPYAFPTLNERSLQRLTRL